MRPTSPLALLLVLLVPLVACGGDSDDDGSPGADTGADVEPVPLEGQWEGTVTLTGSGDEIEVWVHFDLESGGALGLPCMYDSLEMGQNVEDPETWGMRLFRSGNSVYEIEGSTYEGTRQRVVLRGYGDCLASGSGYIYP